MSNLSYFASLTPSAMFSKSQNTARLASELAISAFVVRRLRGPDGSRAGGPAGPPALAPGLDRRVAGGHHYQREQRRGDHAADHRDGERGVGLGAGAQADGGGRQREDDGERGHDHR